MIKSFVILLFLSCETDIILFKIPGIFRIEYDACPGGGVTGYVPNGNDVPYTWRNNSFNQTVLTSMNQAYQDIAYDQTNDMFYLFRKPILVELTAS